MLFILETLGGRGRFCFLDFSSFLEATSIPWLMALITSSFPFASLSCYLLFWFWTSWLSLISILLWLWTQIDNPENLLISRLLVDSYLPRYIYYVRWHIYRFQRLGCRHRWRTIISAYQMCLIIYYLSLISLKYLVRKQHSPLWKRLFSARLYDVVQIFLVDCFFPLLWKFLAIF